MTRRTARTAALAAWFAVLLAASVSAQQPAPKTPHATTVVDPADIARAKPPELTEVETLRLQLNITQAQSVQQQYQLLQMQAQQLAQERESLLAAVEKAHPGWTLDRQTFQFKPAVAPPTAAPPGSASGSAPGRTPPTSTPASTPKK